MPYIEEIAALGPRYSCGCARWEGSALCPDCYPPDWATTTPAPDWVQRVGESEGAWRVRLEGICGDRSRDRQAE